MTLCHLQSVSDEQGVTFIWEIAQIEQKYPTLLKNRYNESNVLETVVLKNEKFGLELDTLKYLESNWSLLWTRKLTSRSKKNGIL